MFTLSVCLAAALASSPQPHRPDSARAVAARVIDALGGDAALKSVRALQIEAVGHDYFIDQSERPEGPWVTRYVQTLEKRDVSGGRSRLETQQRFLSSPDWAGAGSAVIVDRDAAAMNRAERYAPAGRDAFEDGRERIELAPERLLFTALAAPDLALAPDVTVHGIVQRVLAFGWRGRKVTVLIDSGDYVPTAMEIVADDTFGIWGSVRRTSYYSLWTILPGGVRYPLQSDREWNGVSIAASTVMKIAVNQPFDDELFAIPAEVKTAFAALPTTTRFARLTLDPEKARVEIQPGSIVQYGGNWNVEFVRQPDGLVIIEAPIGSAYSVQVLDEAARRYPGVKVKAVITTSDAWPHLGGVREYAARGIPIYALDLNQPILERLFKADYAAHPDAFATARKAPRVSWVSGKTTIGSGETRIDLYPVRGENGERMLMAHFPALKLLYTSDEIQRQGKGFFMPELLLEVRDAIAREHLDVDRVFGFHIGAIPWSEIEAAIAAAAASGSTGR